MLYVISASPFYCDILGLIRYFVYVLGGFNFACLIVIPYWFLQWPILNRFGIQSTLYNFIWTSFAWSVQRIQNVIHLKLWESLRAKNKTFLFCFYFNILPLKKKARAPLKCLFFSQHFKCIHCILAKLWLKLLHCAVCFEFCKILLTNIRSAKENSLLCYIF